MGWEIIKAWRFSLQANRLTAKDWVERILLALLFTCLGYVIFNVFSPYSPTIPWLQDYLGRIGLSTLLLLVSWLLYRSVQYRKYWLIFFGLFIMLLAASLDWIFARFLIDSVQVQANTPRNIALLKLNDATVIILVVLVFNRLSGNSLGSIYIQKGRLRLGLIIGLIAFVAAAAGSVPMAMLFFNGTTLTFERILPWIPWILIFVLANAFMEELLFRGLFLRKLEPFYGKLLSNILIALVFTGLHFLTDYSSDKIMFLAVLFPLALIWGYITQKTDSLWGSVLFHAGMDIPILLGIFSNQF